MKRVFDRMVAAVLMLCMMFSLMACDSGPNSENVTSTASAAPSPTPTEPPADIPADSVDVLTEQWIAVELTFNGSESVKSSDRWKLIMDVVFTHKESGETLTIPAFWDGGTVFKVRFAPTKCGVWEYKTTCEGDGELNGKTGSVGANAYKGDLEMYKHGFVTTNDSKYFVYADGTPFFYLGDTHWTLFTEEYDESGDKAGSIQTNSHFKYIVDKRVEQGFTAYQSQPIGAGFSLELGKISNRSVLAFQNADKYFAYIAQKGLLHANAQFFFTSDMTDKLASNTEYLELISRYWVARYSAYPVMWTLAQECDDDFFHDMENYNDKPTWKTENNPWVKVAEFLHKYDAYKHPLSAHQESMENTSVTGAGTIAENKGIDGGKSAFLLDEVTEKTGHNWWAAQWKGDIDNLPEYSSAKDYWASSKVAINYEDRYCYLWTKNFGAQVRGWVSYLNGFFGYGYGAIDIWYYNSTYEANIYQAKRDGLEDVSPADKATPWSKSVEFESAYQVGYMKKFFEQFEWWKLKPEFDSAEHFQCSNFNVLYACASSDDAIVVLFYDFNSVTGKLKGLDMSAEYTLKWFNPRSGNYEGEEVTFKPDQNGEYEIGDRPGNAYLEDWVLYVSKK